MATGAYLSHKSHREVLDKEVRRERDEITYAPEEARHELCRIYVAKGFTSDETKIFWFDGSRLTRRVGLKCWLPRSSVSRWPGDRRRQSTAFNR